ncbi:unnamed protein product, partial [Rotaria sordida]
LQWIISNNKPVPQGVILHSPWPNLEYFDRITTFSTDNYLSLALATNLRQLTIVLESIDEFSLEPIYFDVTDEELSKISPKDNSYKGFPPLYITVGTDEISFDAIHDMSEKMKLSGVEVILDEGEGLMHTYALFHMWSPQSRWVQEKIRQWIQEQLLIGMQSKFNVNMLATNP